MSNYEKSGLYPIMYGYVNDNYSLLRRHFLTTDKFRDERRSFLEYWHLNRCQWR